MVNIIIIAFALIGAIGLFLIITIGLWRITNDWRYDRMGQSKWSRFWCIKVRGRKLIPYEDGGFYRVTPYNEEVHNLYKVRSTRNWTPREQIRVTKNYWFGR